MGFGENGHDIAIYRFGIIDMLQNYDTRKALERFYKTKIRRFDSNGVSAMDPDRYARRFLRNISLKVM